MRVLRARFSGCSLQEFAELHLSELGTSGMFVQSGQPLPVGTRVKFDFTLETGEPFLSGQAVVVWVTEQTNSLELPAGMELRFEALPLESEQRFEWLLLYKRGAAVGVPPPPALAPGQGQAPDREVSEQEQPEASSTLLSLPELGQTAMVPASQALAVEGAGADSDPDQLFHAVSTEEPGQGPRLPRFGFTRPARRRLRPATLGLALLVAGLSGALAYGLLRVEDIDRARATPLRLLRLASEPPGAEVLLDGLPAGVAPLEIPVRPTSRLVVQLADHQPRQLQLAGQRGWKREGELEVLDLRVRLEPRAHPAGESGPLQPAATRPAASRETGAASRRPRSARHSAPASSRPRPPASQPASQPGAARTEVPAADGTGGAGPAPPRAGSAPGVPALPPQTTAAPGRLRMPVWVETPGGKLRSPAWMDRRVPIGDP